ncbi:MAG TPA: ATP-binding cassette domain-containing protein, partial [Candidatus Thermoplasmatota archaeon]|nr:ATP-binding cassette domain-containing protein [Candidatus Thermoplasmatota archaeon]
PVIARLGFGLQFAGVEKSGLEVMRLTGITKSYGDAKVLKGADLELRKGDRVGLVGGNGEGKSTLLAILTGRLAKDGGTVHVAPGVKGATFSQEQDDLRQARTVREEILEHRPTMREEDVKALAGRFRFDPETDLARTVATLSGGERQRLKLLKCILRPSNLLILDEPTNHLDLHARDVVVKALNSYPGTILLVSHDRYLLDSVTDTTAVLEGGKVHQYQGSFSETRSLHRRRTGFARRRVYVVRKRFADWTANRKYAPGEEVELTEEQESGSMTIRNAIQQGWLEPKS